MHNVYVRAGLERMATGSIAKRLILSRFTGRQPVHILPNKVLYFQRKHLCGDNVIDLLKVKTNPRFGEFFDRIISDGYKAAKTNSRR